LSSLYVVSLDDELIVLGLAILQAIEVLLGGFARYHILLYLAPRLD
jgi:hypothetical protein